MESKLLSGDGRPVGGGNMVEMTNEQQKMLEVRKRDLAEKRTMEREAARQLEETEEKGDELERTYSSMQAEVDAKTKKLRKLFQKLQSTKQDILDVTEEYNRDRRDLEETQQELLKELKLKYLLIENFIPPPEKTKLLSRAQYDEESDSWYMATPGRTAGNTIAKRPVSAAGHRRPVSEYARVLSSMGDGISRFRGENVMRLSLDRPGRTTRDYEGPTVAPRVQAALDAAMLNVEPDIDIDVGALSATAGAVRGQKKGSREEKRGNSKRQHGSGSGGNGHQQQKSFPSSRGLVPK
jgi:hypothetical protein